MSRNTPSSSALILMVCAIGTAAALVSCGGGGNSSGTAGGSTSAVSAQLKQEALDSSVAGAIRPGYATAQSALATLRSATTEFCADRTGTRFATLQTGWRAGMAAWQGVNAITSGPAAQDSLALRIEAWPSAFAAATATRMDQLLAGTSALDEAAIAGQPVQAQGLQALEYLLFQGRSATDFPANATGDRRCALLAAVAANLATMGSTLNVAWQQQGAAQALTGSSTATSAEAYNLLGNLLLGQLVRLKDSALGPVIGLDTSGAAFNPNAAAAEAIRSDTSLDQVVSQLQAAIKLFDGGSATSGNAGFARVLEQTGKTALRSGFRTRADDALAQAQALLTAGKELSSANADTATTAQFSALFNAVRTLETYTQNQVLPALDITVTFNFNDGD